MLWIANHEEGAWAQNAVLPTRRSVVRGDSEQDLRLDRIRVLELVDQDVAITTPELATDVIVLADELARPLQEIVEVENGRGALEGGVISQHLIELLLELGHQRCGALKAAVKPPPKIPDPLGLLVNALQPAVKDSRTWPGDPVENAVDANIHLMANKLEEKFKGLGVVVKRKRYSLDTGLVTDPQPWKP